MDLSMGKNGVTMEVRIIQFERPPDFDAIPMDRRFVETKAHFRKCMEAIEPFTGRGVDLLTLNDLMLSVVVSATPELFDQLGDFLASQRMGSIAANSTCKAAVR